jgi:hypothetical protein
MVRRVVLGGGAPLVGPQEELRSPGLRGYTPRGFIRAQDGKRRKDFRVYNNKKTNKKTKKQNKVVVICGVLAVWRHFKLKLKKDVWLVSSK